MRPPTPLRTRHVAGNVYKHPSLEKRLGDSKGIVHPGGA